MSVLGQSLRGLRGSVTDPGRTLTREGGVGAGLAGVGRRLSTAGGGWEAGLELSGTPPRTPGLPAGSQINKGTSRVWCADKFSEVTQGQGGRPQDTGLTLTPPLPQCSPAPYWSPWYLPAGPASPREPSVPTARRSFRKLRISPAWDTHSPAGPRTAPCGPHRPRGQQRGPGPRSPLRTAPVSGEMGSVTPGADPQQRHWTQGPQPPASTAPAPVPILPFCGDPPHEEPSPALGTGPGAHACWLRLTQHPHTSPQLVQVTFTTRPPSLLPSRTQGHHQP